MIEVAYEQHLKYKIDRDFKTLWKLIELNSLKKVFSIFLFDSFIIIKTNDVIEKLIL